MKSSAKQRRSKRIPAKHPLMISISGSGGSEVFKEFVSTVELSKHGAKVRGRQALAINAEGILTQLKSLHKAPFRVAWQVDAPGGQGYLDTGLELLAEFEFWEQFYSDSDPKPAPSAVPPPEIAAIEEPAVSPHALFQELLNSSMFQAKGTGRVLEGVWCNLIEQLEERKIFTRAELVESLKKIAKF